MGKANITFDKIEVLEWYDGIVRAIGEVRNQSYLMVLVSWDMKQSIKLYALVDLSEATKNKIVNELASNKSKEENWELFNSIFDHYIETYEGDMFLFHGEIEKNKTYSLKLIDSNHIKKLVNYEFEDSIE